MKFDFKTWLNLLSIKLNDAFGERIVFTGYQGSYRRGEATEASDIDMVVILDDLTIADLNNYRNIVRSMPFSEKACGFICGRKELMAWPQGDVFQLINDTQPIQGSLDYLLAIISNENIKTAVASNSANLYHMANHCYLYDQNLAQSLIDLYKMTFFILQAIIFLQTGVYYRSKKELAPKLDKNNAEILNFCINRDKFPTFSQKQIEQAYEKLINWCSDNMMRWK